VNLENVIVAHNSARGDGAGIQFYHAEGTVRNALIASNSGGVKGGGLMFDGCSPTFVNVTVVDNWTAGHGGGLNVSYMSQPTLVNSIVWGNAPEQIYFDTDWPGEAVTIEYSDIQGGAAGIVTSGHGPVYWGNGNLDASPRFVNAGLGNYHLADDSPCIGVGKAAGAPVTDIEGNPRPNPAGSNPDMGAYENPSGLKVHLPKVYLPFITRPIDPDTLLLLHFDEPAGTTLFQDSSPYKHHAMCHSSACPTKAERGLDFDGQDSYLMSSASIQGLSSFTLAGWYYARSYEHAGKLPVVFFAPGVDCPRAALRIGGGYTEGPVLFVADTDNCVPQMVVSVSGVPALNQWHHIVAVFDSDTDRHAIYINGEKAAENGYPIGPIADTTPGHPMYIGVNYSPRPYDQRWWDGYIDEVVLYSRALSASEVEALYRSTR
jgi:hypothetical protein